MKMKMLAVAHRLAEIARTRSLPASCDYALELIHKMAADLEDASSAQPYALETLGELCCAVCNVIGESTCRVTQSGLDCPQVLLNQTRND